MTVSGKPENMTEREKSIRMKSFSMREPLRKE